MRVMKFMAQLSKPYRKNIYWMIIAITMVTLATTTRPYIIKQFIDIVTNEKDMSLWAVFFGYAVLQAILVSGWYLKDYYYTSFVASFRLNIAEHFMKKLYEHPYSFFQNQLAGSLTSKINDVFQNLPNIISTSIFPFGSFILMLIISLILVSFVSPIFALILLIWVCLFWIITFMSIRTTNPLQRDYAEEKAKIIGLVADYLSNIINVKLFASKNFEIKLFKNLKNGFIAITFKQGFYFMKFYLIQGILTTLYALGFMLFLIQGYKNDYITPGDFAFIIMINFDIISLVYEMSHVLREFVTNWGSVDQALKLLENEDTSYLDLPGSRSLNVIEGNISFRKVKFHYKNTETLFKNKTIDIQSKQKIGLVGYSGGGKSTFVNLVLRLHEVTEGSIMIDDQDIKNVTQDSLRQNIAMIPQDPSLFHRSLMDNIRYGRDDATDEEVIKAAIKAHAHEFITKLPQGYESLVGERGVKLSGGQRQRIAIARAILKDAPILIMDEATSQLDSLTENLIQESLLELMKNKTTIIIAHRLSTLLHMDRILVFDKGKIVEDGTHEVLLKKNGMYTKLWDAQVGGFLSENKIRS